MNLPVSRWPSVTTKGVKTRYDTQGRLDLSLYALHCLHYADAMQVLASLSRALHAPSEVTYKRCRPKFRVKAERPFFFCGKTRTSPVLRWCQTRAFNRVHARSRRILVCEHPSLCDHVLTRVCTCCFPWDIHIYRYAYICVFRGACFCRASKIWSPQISYEMVCIILLRLFASIDMDSELASPVNINPVKQ